MPFVVLVQGEQLGSDAVMPQQVRGHPRVLGSNHIDLFQDIKRAQRDIGQIPNRRRDYI